MGENVINTGIIFGYNTFKTDFINGGRHSVYLRGCLSGVSKEKNCLIGHNSALIVKGGKDNSKVYIRNEEARNIWLYYVDVINIRLAGGSDAQKEDRAFKKEWIKPDGSFINVKTLSHPQALKIYPRPNQMIYKGDINEDKQEHGKGTITWPEVAIGYGNWTNGVLQGEGKLVLKNGLVFEGKWHKKVDGNMGMYVGPRNEHGPNGRGKFIWVTKKDSYQLVCDWKEGVPQTSKSNCVSILFKS